MDGGVWGEWIAEDEGLGELFVDPRAAVHDGHEADHYLAIDGGIGEQGLLGFANVLAVGGVVGHWRRPPVLSTAR